MPETKESPTCEDRRTRNARMFRAYQEGASLSGLARREGLHKSTVHYALQSESRRTGEALRSFDRAHNRRAEAPKCRHCENAVVCRPLGLCWTCYHTPAVRGLYSPLSKFARRGSGLLGGGCKQPDSPTSAPPGSREKMAVLEARAELGESLWHPKDVRLDLD